MVELGGFFQEGRSSRAAFMNRRKVKSLAEQVQPGSPTKGVRPGPRQPNIWSSLLHTCVPTHSGKRIWTHTSRAERRLLCQVKLAVN